MKKIKLLILTGTILLAVAGAFATKPHFDCTTLPQYYYNTAAYIPVSQWYGCMQSSQTCTYYTLNGGITYSPCAVGAYNDCAGCVVEPAPKK